MSAVRRLCVFCGSNVGRSTGYRRLAEQLGRALAGRRVGLVYGGGRVGLMGALADAALVAGGEVIGIIPQALMDREIGHRGLTELRVVGSMHERKASMAELADGFVALPGGLGTLEEVVEQLTWAQLGRHKKPILIANINGYWDPLLALIEHMRAIKFVPSAFDVEFLVATRVEDILPTLRAAARDIVDAEKTMAVPAERL